MMTLNSLKCQLRTCLGIFQLFITLRQQLQQSKQNTNQTGAERKCPSDSSEIPTLWRAGPHTSTMSETALTAFRKTKSSNTSSESYKWAVGAHGKHSCYQNCSKGWKHCFRQWFRCLAVSGCFRVGDVVCAWCCQRKRGSMKGRQDIKGGDERGGKK